MSVALSAASAAPATGQAPIRVMVVDDAVVVRGLVSRWIEEEAGLVLAASVRTGRDAVAQVERARPDVVVLDVDMPELDGISALPLLLEKNRDLVVIMASTLTRRNAEVSLRALSLGAADYIPKPETNHGITTSATFRRELIDKIRQLGGQRRRRDSHSRPPPAASPGTRSALRAVEPAVATSPSIKLRPFPAVLPRVLVIGSSTGGPQALTQVVAGLGCICERVPVLITQHMPPTFTTILAEHLARASGRPAYEPTDGEPINPGTLYLAPGGKHMRVARRHATPVIAIDEGPLVNFCRPAVDPLFSSVAQVWGSATLGLILTGMGSDGTQGAGDIVAAGGSVIAQDEATSVVWGMPGSAAQAGWCSAVLPLDQIAPKLLGLFTRDRT
jgi:two-component system, chemotaxis family, protein-glutamate methylesterase/glutaminase